MGRKLEVDLVANARPFNNTLDAAQKRVTGFSGRLKALGGGSLGKGAAIGVGIGGFNLLTSAIGLAVGKMDEMHQAFLEDEAQQVVLANTIKNTVANYEEATKAAEAFATAQAELGFADGEVRESIGQLLGVTKDMEETYRIVGLAQDLARAKNITLAQATDVLTRAYQGQGRGLVALGIDVKGVTNGTELLRRAYENVKGAASAYANTGAGKVAKANVKMEETMEKLGKAIDVVSQIVIPVMLTGLSAIVDLAGAIIGAFATAARVLNENFGPALAAIGDIARAAATPLAILADIGANIAGALSGGGGGQGQQGNSQSRVTTKKYGVPIHHQGGVVAGPPGSNQLIMAQAGEQITPAGKGTGPTIIVNIESFIGSDRDIDRFADRLAFRLRATSLG